MAAGRMGAPATIVEPWTQRWRSEEEAVAQAAKRSCSAGDQPGLRYVAGIEDDQALIGPQRRGVIRVPVRRPLARAPEHSRHVDEGLWGWMRAVLRDVVDRKAGP